jgi:hypothetical protein
MIRRVIALVGGIVWMASLTAMGQGAAEQHCAVLLVATGPGSEPGAIATREEDLGCYPTYTEAIAAGAGVDVAPPADPDVVTSVLIGTEYTSTSFTGSSKSYFAAETCSATVSWEVSYVGDAWNDDFESGKGFGGCGHNKKFHDSNFGGASITCTPSCSDYGTLRNEVSSLRWKV